MITAVILIGVAVITACAVNLKPTNAAGEGNFASVGEIYQNCNNVQKLYDLIGGAEHTSFSTITQMATAKTNAADLRAKTYNKTNAQDIQVTFGGQVWDVVYLSMTNDNRPILTLWLHEPFSKCQWNKWALNNVSVKYPSNMYGTSYVRALINNGGKYAQDKDSLIDYEPVADYALQNFLPNGKYDDLIVTPSFVTWQENGEDARVADNESYARANENWGIVNYKFNTVSGVSMNYSEREGNDVWKDDNLWLVSNSEVSETSKSIWRVSSNQRASLTWSRAGTVNNTADVILCLSGNSRVPTSTEMVRPALHLDLTALNEVRVADDTVGHNYNEWQTTTVAGCTTDGEQQRTCQNCGHVDSEVLPALGHEYKSSFDQSTGNTTFVCSRCQDSYVKSCTDTVNGHHFSETITAPKCEDKGYTTYLCDTCGYSYQGNFVPATGHSFGAWTTIEPATTNAAGVQRRICEHCGAEQTRSIAPLAGTTTNGGKDNSAPLLWGIIIGIIAVLAGCGGLAWLLLVVFKPKKEKKAKVAAA